METFAVSETPEVVHKTIIDAMFFLRLQVNLPKTFEAIARYILETIVNCEGETNYNMWQVDWTINKGREDKGSLKGMYSIKGPAQIRPSDSGESL